MESDDGTLVGTLGMFGDVRIWQTEARKRIADFPSNGHKRGDIAFVPGSRSLLMVTSDKVTLYTPTSGGWVGKELPLPRADTVVFQPGGKVLILGTEKEAIAYSWPERVRLRSLPIAASRAMRMSPNGKYLWTCGNTTEFVIDVTTVKGFSLPTIKDADPQCAFSPDSKRFVRLEKGGMKDGSGEVRALPSGDLIQTLTAPVEMGGGFFFRDPNHVIMRSDKYIVDFDILGKKAKPVLEREQRKHDPGSFVLSHNGLKFFDEDFGILSETDFTALGADRSYGSKIADYSSPLYWDSRSALLGGTSAGASIFDFRAGTRSMLYPREVDLGVFVMALDAEQRRLAYTSLTQTPKAAPSAEPGKDPSGSMVVHDLQSGEASRYPAEGFDPVAGAISFDQNLVAARSKGEFRLTRLDTGAPVATIPSTADGRFTFLHRTPGFVVAAAGSARIYRAPWNSEPIKIEGDTFAVAVRSDDQIVFSGRKLLVVDPTTFAIREIPMGDKTFLTGLGVSEGSGSQIAAGDALGGVRFYDFASGALLASISDRDTSSVLDMNFSRDGHFAFATALDGHVKILDARRHVLIATLFMFGTEDWAAVTPDGRFDGTREGLKNLHYVVGLEPVELSQLKGEYYEPNLLAKLMGFTEEPLRAVRPLTRLDLYPSVKTELVAGGTAVRVTATDRGGGIGQVQLLLNDKLIDQRHPQDSTATVFTYTVDLTSFSGRLIPKTALKSGERNKIEVRATNRDEVATSRATSLTLPAPEKAAEPPRIWMIIAGSSDYQGEDLDLKFAAKDAADFAQAMRIAAGRYLTGPDQVHIKLLTASPGSVKGESLPTKANLLAAFAELKKGCRSTDIVLVYLSGHGSAAAGQDADYYYLTCDARSVGDLENPSVRAGVTLSSTELASLMNAIPAQKQVLILDTCASGRAAEKLSASKTVPGSTIRSWERMQDRTGLFILAGSAANAVSYEASRYGQGLLTYSLLEALRKGAALRRDPGDNVGFVDVALLLGFATDEVPELAKGIGGVQRPHLGVRGDGRSFDIGQLSAEDQLKVPLSLLKPVLVRPNFQDADVPRDSLGLTRRLGVALRELQPRGAAAGFIFWDLEAQAGAYSIAGRYRVVGDEVVATVYLSSLSANGDEVLDKEVAKFEVRGASKHLEGLVEKILSEAQKRLPAGST